MKRLIFLAAAAMATSGFAHQAQPTFEENFDAPLSDAWRQVAREDQSRYRVEDGVLKVTCLPNPLQGGYLEIPVPTLRKGTLEFRLKVDATRSGNARGFAFYLDLYHLGLWWHDYVGDWRRYLPEAESQRIHGYRIEPVGHRSLTKITKGVWHQYRVTFDADLGEIAYYFNDMENPVWVDFDLPVLGRAEFQGGVLRIGSLGHVNGPVEYHLDDLRLTEGSPPREAGENAPSMVILEGIGNSGPQWKTPEDGVRRYAILNPAVALRPENHFKFQHFPTSEVISEAKTIVWGDLPLTSEVLPYPLQRRIVERVRNGAHLILQSGLFALNKGEAGQSPLLEILPVKGMDHPWAWERVEKPGPWKGIIARSSLPASGSLFFQTLTPVEGADILLRSGERPAVVSQKVGNGRVTVLLARGEGPLFPDDPWGINLVVPPSQP